MTLSIVILALAIEALVLVVIELVREHYTLVAWAVLLLAIAQILVRI